jgi:hypothetical protein
MTWQEIRVIYPWLPETSDDWHQHVKGGGWVHANATVCDAVFVGERAIIKDGTFHGGAFYGGMFYGGTFYGGMFHGGAFYGGMFYGGTFHGGTFYDGTFYGGTFHGGTFHGGTFYDGTFYDGTFYDGAFYDGTFRGGDIYSGEFYGGTIKDGVITRSPILIHGSRYWIGYSGEDLVSSGCITKPLAWWLENVERCAEEHGYTIEEQKEYRMHVEYIAAWMRLHGYV